MISRPEVVRGTKHERRQILRGKIRPQHAAHAVTLRKPGGQDGLAVNRLIRVCAPLDENSVYCNLLQCTHFAASCVLADSANGPLGFLSAYRPPARPDTIFVWQVAVHPKGRGAGLARRMLDTLLARPVCHGVRYLETTITDDNQASWRLFMALARDLAAPAERSTQFDCVDHFGGQHDSEYLLRIGPFDTPGSGNTTLEKST